jgi:hypothetical protein
MAVGFGLLSGIACAQIVEVSCDFKEVTKYKLYWTCPCYKATKFTVSFKGAPQTTAECEVGPPAYKWESDTLPFNPGDKDSVDCTLTASNYGKSHTVKVTVSWVLKNKINEKEQ